MAPAVVDALLRHGSESRATAYKAAGVVLNLVEDEDAAEVQVRWGVGKGKEDAAEVKARGGGGGLGVRVGVDC